MAIRTRSAGLGLLVALLATGCAGRSEPPPMEAQAPPQADVPPPSAQAELPPNGTTREDRYWLPALFATEEDEVHYFISRLADRRFIDTYGGDEHPRVWYIAAERLGQIGKPAVPLLFSLIDSTDPYELMLVLYALQLATQDPALLVETGGDYVQLGSVLAESANLENRQIALAWWQRHGWRWE
ncbi:hypothetical protein [Billgrantia montanilacus]|uniref:HEAT repeat domain-containing protein n=1 Tax=Billgrantia montanilacus TaxID=2282305 RepID=A0A368U2N7_9GAMM|nr:hypothetical protein [Halomonas montanilacus]RCV91264.1 hypothetical protein DU505_05150 [Halomonas montanilacus]